MDFLPRARKRVLILTIVLLILSPLYFSSSEVDAAPGIGSTTVTLYPVADAYVNSSSPDTNYGDVDHMYVGNNSEQDFVYVMFDLSSITSKANVISANLSLYLSSTGGDIYWYPADKIGVYYCSNNSWTELGITWDNKPSFNSELTDTYTFLFMYYVKEYKSWNVTEDVRTAFPSGTLTEVLKFERKTEDGYALFHSKEGTYKPKLEVEYEAPLTSLQINTTIGGTTEPEPGTYEYIIDTSVNVTAIPNLGYSFDYWLLDGEERTENPITVIMYANRTLEAFFVDDVPPEIGVPVQEPPEDVAPYQNVTVTVNVNDVGSGLYNVTLWYRALITLWYSADNGTSWMHLNMTEIFPDTYQTKILGYGNCTWVTYKIIAYDNNGNPAINDNDGYYYTYHVIPEFPSFLILPLLMIATLLVGIVYRRKQT